MVVQSHVGVTVRTLDFNLSHLYPILVSSIFPEALIDIISSTQLLKYISAIVFVARLAGVLNFELRF